jgi:hypothetical protein
MTKAATKVRRRPQQPLCRFSQTPRALVEATEVARANAAQLVEPNEVNDAPTVPWITYLLLILGAALIAAALAIWCSAGRTSVYAHRAGRPRVHMSNS